MIGNISWGHVAGGLCALLACALIVGRLLGWFTDARPSRDSSEAPAKLEEYAGRSRDYIYYIGVPCEQPTRWVRVRDIEDEQVICEADERYPLAKVRSCIVTYPTGGLLYSAALFHPLPEGLTWEELTTLPFEDSVDKATLARGLRYVSVAHGAKRRGEGGKAMFSTFLANVSSERVRVLRFAFRGRRDGQQPPTKVSGKYFTAEEFAVWYGVDESGWIQPGQTVSDPDNWVPMDGLWIYVCESESGEQFVTGLEAEL